MAAQKRQQSARKGKYKSNEFRFVNISFSDKEKADIVSWVEQRKPEIADSLVRISEKGYKISISHNGWSGQMAGALTQKSDNHPGYNRCVTYEHMDIERLVQVLEYLVTERLEHEAFYGGEGRPTEDW